MAEFGMPFDMPQNPENPEDYLFSAAEERMRIGAEMTDGIFPEIRLITTDATAPEQVIGNSLVVTAGEGLNVVLGKGTALCGSTFYFNTESKTIPVEAGTNDIVVELNLANSNISVINQPRTTGNIEDSLIRTASRWQIALATVTVPEGSECVDFSMITDHRLNTTACSSPDGRPVCGLVGSALQLSSQMFLDEWEYIKGKLAEDPAASLQFQIGDLNNLKTKNKSNHVAAINEVLESAKMTITTLFEGSGTASTETFTLIDNVSNYDLIITLYTANGSTLNFGAYPPEYLMSGVELSVSVDDDNRSATYSSDGTSVTLESHNGILKPSGIVYGIKLGG